jgi:DNA-binding NarL/FixJ family response regulator
VRRGPLKAEIRTELAAAGVRAPRPRHVRRNTLTASELRVCRLATEGMTNREIAQALFVTTKTVEAHLRASFRKLDIRSRKLLRDALSSEQVN